MIQTRSVYTTHTILSSKVWKLNTADVKGAYLCFPKKERPNCKLYVQLPNGHPGHPCRVVESLRGTYGRIDGYVEWYESLSQYLSVECGLAKSELDPAPFMKYDCNGNSIGIVCTLVNDLITGGVPEFEKMYGQLKPRFTFGKWSVGDGDFPEGL